MNAPTTFGKPPTKKQAEALDAIREFVGQGVTPSALDLQRRLGLAGRGAICSHLAALKARGLIEFEYARTRSIRLVEPGSLEQQQVKAMKAYERQIQNGIGWTDERIDLLKKLWQGGVSAGRIAKQIGGCTRSAVIGKVHRLGLQHEGRAEPAKPERVARAPRPVRIDANPTPKPRPQARAFGETRVPLPAPRLAIAGNGTVFDTAPDAPTPSRMEPAGLATMETLGRCMCKWPIGDPLQPGFTFCGRKTGEIYCGVHAPIAYQPPAAKKPKDPSAELARALRRYV